MSMSDAAFVLAVANLVTAVRGGKESEIEKCMQRLIAMYNTQSVKAARVSKYEDDDDRYL